MAPVIFTGVSMRAILLAAAAAIWAGNAGAAVYTLTFIADEPYCYGEGEFECFENPQIVLDVPSFKNLDIFQDYDTGDGSEWLDDLIPPVLGLPQWPTGWSTTVLRIKTDAAGKLVDLWFEWDAYWEGQYLTLNDWSGYWINQEGFYTFGTGGTWDVSPSPVPLPATAPLLLMAISGAVALRRRSGRNA
ncbi:VPLPA-CTERM sorting domain-containing protein [Neotabrizicola sp. sgz301269]|uniref:VPLPA-CTERM sorting domain-containing protein n=1 Tax=Neotabrizicola sp. sgz301269 TaxID=3276282 RepID=UPI00376FD144